MTEVRTMTVVATLLLAACHDKSQPPDWRLAPVTHTCTAEQMERVESETLFCTKETGFISSYCYATAITRNCTEESAHE